MLLPDAESRVVLTRDLVFTVLPRAVATLRAVFFPVREKRRERDFLPPETSASSVASVISVIISFTRYIYLS